MVNICHSILVTNWYQFFFLKKSGHDSSTWELACPHRHVAWHMGGPACPCTTGLRRQCDRRSSGAAKVHGLRGLFRRQFGDKILKMHCILFDTKKWCRFRGKIFNHRIFGHKMVAKYGCVLNWWFVGDKYFCHYISVIKRWLICH